MGGQREGGSLRRKEFARVGDWETKVGGEAVTHAVMRAGAITPKRTPKQTLLNWFPLFTRNSEAIKTNIAVKPGSMQQVRPCIADRHTSYDISAVHAETISIAHLCLRH